MPSFRTVRHVPYSAEQMFRLVADVERYPEFLPMCESLRVSSRTPVDGKEVLVATMGVGIKAMRESFTTRVTLDAAAPAILVEYLDGPFRRLENRWRFVETPAGCDTDFFIDYEFRSPMLALLMGTVFDKAFRHLTDAFETRARTVYGSPASGLGA